MDFLDGLRAYLDAKWLQPSMPDTIRPGSAGVLIARGRDCGLMYEFTHSFWPKTWAGGFKVVTDEWI